MIPATDILLTTLTLANQTEPLGSTVLALLQIEETIQMSKSKIPAPLPKHLEHALA